MTAVVAQKMPNVSPVRNNAESGAVSDRSAAGGKRVIVAGAGNTGSHVLGHLARDPLVGEIVVVDFDSYSKSNLVSQAIERHDVGRPKAVVQAERLSRIRGPGHRGDRLKAVPLVARLEDVPLGLMRADVILGCLDSRLARRELNRVAWRLGVPWVDCGVQADGILARVNAYFPGG